MYVCMLVDVDGYEIRTHAQMRPRNVISSAFPLSQPINING